MESAVSKASFMVDRMTPVGPRLTHPEQYMRAPPCCCSSTTTPPWFGTTHRLASNGAPSSGVLLYPRERGAIMRGAERPARLWQAYHGDPICLRSAEMSTRGHGRD